MTQPACTREAEPCEKCGTVVIAATGDPTAIFPPLAGETVARDIGDQVYERLADLAPGGAPIDSTAYQPRLASRWERLDSVTWRFHLRPGARWQDGRPVTSEDVRFSFRAFSDSVIDPPARSYLENRITVVPEDSSTFVLRFAAPSSEQLYDATYHVRIVPSHVWASKPSSSWTEDTTVANLVGSGPYRVSAWRRGQFVTLDADTTGGKSPAIRRAIWRFAPDPDAALNLVLSHEADLLETVGSPERALRVAADTTLRLVPYAAAVYGFLGFKIAGAGDRPHPILSDRATRRALAAAIDRRTLARSLFGPEAKAPPGPMSQLLWIWNDSIATIAFDTAAAAAALEEAGWRAGGGKARTHAGKPLTFDILVPSTSSGRRQLALLMQEMWRRVGVDVTVTAVDFPVFQQRLARGRFDAYIGAWLDEPSPRGLADQWTRAGWAALNYGHYYNPHFDALFAKADRVADVPSARRLYREAMDTLNADAPGIFLYAPANIAVVSRRIEGVDINPYGWASGLPAWRAVR
ncbi:MAG TPA: peptide ABC transporter substrate-binding protein [Gemmatimonadales bacterium]|jgi:peptide/nickel transport system substrate-binding protein